MIAALKRWYLKQLIQMHTEEAQHADDLASDQRRLATMHYYRADELKRKLMIHDLSHYEESLKGN